MTSARTCRIGAVTIGAGLLASAALAAGADELFMETHPAPAKAKPDSASMISLGQTDILLRRCLAVFEAAR